MVNLLTSQQTQLISGGEIAIDLDDRNFIMIPTDGIPKPCARSLEYGFNGLMAKELTTPDVIAVTMVYGKCTLSDYQVFIKNIESILGKS